MGSQIELLDAVCGTGKSSSIIAMMKKNPTERYLYISPVLKEIEERIPDECEELDFKCPEVDEVHNTKAASLLSLVQEGHNVAFTHSLYTKLTRDHLNTIELMGYTLIIDEEVTLIEPLSMGTGGSGEGGYSDADIRYLYQSGKLSIDERDCGRVHWTWDGYGNHAKYSMLKNMCDLGMVYCTTRPAREGDESVPDTSSEMGSLVVQLPMGLITSCARCIVVSYLFRGSIMETFLKMRGVGVVDFDMDREGVSLRYDPSTIKSQIRPLVNFVETPSTKKIGRRKLTYTWYQNEFTQEDVKLLNSAIRSVGVVCGATYEDVMWTAPKNRSVKPKSARALYLNPRGYSGGHCYVYCACRATNDYSHKHTLIHALYRHPNVVVSSYLSHYGFPVDIDNFALAELVQWVWRSRIRNKKPINLCILSKRMEMLFRNWLEEDV